MTERTVSVRLKAEVSDYIAKVGQAAAATKGLATEVSKMSASHKQQMQDVGRATAVGGGALLALGGLALKTGADFEKAMSGVKAATGASAKEFTSLRAAAIKAGADTSFSAMDAAAAERELAKAGVSVKDTLGGGLSGALSLAAAGQLDVGQAAAIAATSMTQFGLAGKDIPHIADLLAAGAGKAQGEVTDMATALKYVGPVAHQMGISIEETSGTIALLASNGILADQAGTSLRGMLTALTSPSKMAADRMQKLGINVYDAQGNFVGFNGVAGQLQKSMGGLDNATRDQALGQIFGNEQITAARVLYAGGAKAVDSWTGKVTDAAYATRTAATMTDNLRGDIERLGGSLQTALIDSSSGDIGFARTAVQGVTSLVNAYSSLPAPAKTATSAVTGMVGAAGLAGGGFLLLAPRVVETRAALGKLAETAPNATKALSTAATVAGKAVLVVGAAVAAYQGSVAVGLAKSQGDLDKFTSTVAAGAGPDSGAQIQALQGKLRTLKEESNKGWANGEIFGYGVRLSTDAYKAGQQVLSLQDRIAALKEQQKLMASAAADAGVSQETFAAALANGVTPAVWESEVALKKYTTALNDSVAIDAYTANANLAKSFHDLSRSLKDGGKVTNDEKIALGGFASDVRRTASAVFDQTGSQDKANASMARGKRHFIDLATQAGYSAKAARRLADDLLAIPARTDVTVDANTARARAQVTALIHSIQSSGATLPVSIGVANKVTAGGPKHAAGGFITGPGTATSDTIPAWLSNGEYVVKAAAVAKYGSDFLDRVNDMRFARGGAVASDYALASNCEPLKRPAGLAPVACTFAPAASA